MERWHIGCSGFHYKHWRGTFYPEKLAMKYWFSYYTEHFNTLELNVTFYRFPKLSVFQNWYNNSAAPFRFAVKAPRLITHYKKFNDTAALLDNFYHTLSEGLKEKLGCCLFQLPPNYQYSPEKLEKITSSLHNDFPNVVEFRHESWWRQEVFDELSHHKISFCGMSHPELPAERVHNNDLLYYRFHGENQLYASNYTTAQLQQCADEIKKLKNLKQGYIFFNNDIHTHAIYNAKALQQMLKN